MKENHMLGGDSETGYEFPDNNAYDPINTGEDIYDGGHNLGEKLSDTTVEDGLSNASLRAVELEGDNELAASEQDNNTEIIGDKKTAKDKFYSKLHEFCEPMNGFDLNQINSGIDLIRNFNANNIRPIHEISCSINNGVISFSTLGATEEDINLPTYIYLDASYMDWYGDENEYDGLHNVEESDKEVLYKFLEKHIDTTYDEWEEYDEYNDCDEFYSTIRNDGSPFPWGTGRGLPKSSKQFDDYNKEVNQALNEFEHLIPESKRQEIESLRKEAQLNAMETISEDVKKFNLTMNQANFLEDYVNLFEFNEDDKHLLDTAKNYTAELLNKYGEGFFKEIGYRNEKKYKSVYDHNCNAITNVLYRTVVNDSSEDTRSIEEKLYSNIANDTNKFEVRGAIINTNYRGTLEQNELLSRIELSDEMFERGLAMLPENLDDIDYSYPSVLEHNTNLSETQARKLLNLYLERLTDESISYNVYSQIDNIFENNNFSNDYIYSIFNSSDRGKKLIYDHCRNIPEDIVNAFLDDPSLYDANRLGTPGGDNVNRALTILWHNTGLSHGSLEKFYEFTQKAADIYGSGTGTKFREAMMRQENASIDMMKNIIDDSHKGNFIWYKYLERDEKPQELTERFANNEWYTQFVAKSVAAGEVGVMKETLQKLALSGDVDDEVKEVLLDMLGSDEVLPKVDINDGDISTYTWDETHGGDGPGSFDNMGGARNFEVMGKVILREPGIKDSYGEDAESRKWARNAFTNFDMCWEPEAFKMYCEDHKHAISIMVQNDELYESRKLFKERVEMIEDNLAKHQEQ